MRHKLPSDDYRWSSFQEYPGKRAAETWLKRDFVLGFFANSEAQAAEKYRRFIEETVEKEQKSPLNESVASTILGSPEFVEFIQAQYVDQIKATGNFPYCAIHVGRQERIRSLPPPKQF
jgi:hypothetical protein